ncbi:hypothetical protein V5O48_018700, partial [Marasmius crinis-equi]
MTIVIGRALVLIFLGLANLTTLAIADLRSDLAASGVKALLPGDDGYDSASNAFNRRFTFSPAAITYPSSPTEVSKSVTIGAANNLQVVARSGGHSFIANGLGGKDGALVLDLSNMRSISIDSSTHFATIEPGNRLGDVAVNLNQAGRALPHGVCPYVGIGGHSGTILVTCNISMLTICTSHDTAFGGWGFTSRMWGLTLDTIKAVNTVLANGTIARITADNYPDLFFALRGAAPSFGITTSVEVETFPAPEQAVIHEYFWDLDAEAAGQALFDLQSFFLDTKDLPSEYGGTVIFQKGGAAGKVAFTFAGGWYGETGKLQSIIKPFLDKLPQPSNTSLPMAGNGTYIDAVKILAGGSLDLTQPETPDTFYTKSLMTPEGQPMTREAARSFVNYISDEGFRSGTDWLMQALVFGGTNSKVNVVPVDTTAFVRRDSLFTWDFRAASADHQAPFPDDGLTFIDGAYNSLVGSMPSNWDYSAYINYIDDRLDN